MMPEMEMVKDAALKYDKPTLGRMAQMGQLSPTIAVMAGMMRDRIVQSEMKPPAPPTVAEEVMQPMGQRMGIGAIAPGAEMQGQPQQPPQGGLSQIPVPEQMFDRPEMASGGIVAFQAGGGPALMAQYEKEVREMSEGRRMQFSPELKPIIDQMQAPRRASEQSFLQREQARMLNNPMISFSGALAAQGQPTTPAQQIAIPGVDDSAEMARLARQAQGTGVPLSSSGLAALTQETPPPPGPKPEPGPEPTSAVPGLREQLLGRIKEAFPDQAGGAKPTEPSVKGLFQERAEAERIAGVDKNFFENEAKRIVALSDKLKGDKNEAANMRLIEAGLRIMGGESPYAFVNIGKGASEALKGFADDVKDIQKTKREYDKAERELRTAEQLYARNKSDEALKEVQRRRELAQQRNTSFQTAMMDMELKLKSLSIQEEGVRAQAAAAAKPSQFQEITTALRSKDPGVRRSAEQFLGAGKMGTLTIEDALKVVKDMPKNIGANPQELMRQAQELVASQGAATRFQGFSAKPMGQ
jgi:hypothetical protein